ncbi:MAG TPA: laccase domain-containing protein, partial [Pseudoxanthomonas sp.]|nr:laccase domain-containing protein [Pseudoxanthomonas sp.]
MNAAVWAQWPAPGNVRAFTTLRHGAGNSLPPFDHFNLGNRTAADGDDPATVERNRAELVGRFELPSVPHWLRQVHGTEVL